ncbi:M13 family metallopeptidase [Sphingomonas sp.]|uniref:M13 family metallopeptidase n=1 Tax=Sphingomonas sp. TaxID=28214 RepID=UPI001DCB68B4|nr:M13 family metallopeptidase [Sphingomonas sp.]MBX9796814.1 M13 family metallopeptidase [Sphingomonas sp.]
MRNSIFVSALLAGAALAGVAIAKDAARPAAPAAGKPEIGSFGFDEAGMDRTVAAGDNFAQFAGGTWAKTTEIPLDRSSFGMFHVLQERSLAQTRTILDEATKQRGSKIGDFYASYLDQAAIDAKGATPLAPWFAQIKGAGDRDALAVVLAGLQRQGVNGLIGVYVGQDDKQPDRYITNITQSGLGLPDRDYYLKDDAKLAKVREAYLANSAQMLNLIGEGANAQARVQAVFEFEKKLAAVHWTRIESRDSDKTYNKWTAADFAAKAPGMPWEKLRAALGVAGEQEFIVAQPSAITGEAKVFSETPVEVLRDYAMLRSVRSFAAYLAKPIDDANFDFYGKVLTGQPQQRDRWKRAVNVVSAAMGEEIGKVYVARYFPPATKKAADALVQNVIAAMGERIRNLSWMTPETKQKALAKLASFTPKIGYPSQWRDYSTLSIVRGDLVGNVARANAFEYDRGLAKLGKPIDRGEWFMTPMTINAYANPVLNEIVFPAAILQPPFFDAKADPAVNYGGIGAVIGHEISHHFDDQGRKYDQTGKLTDWWTAADVAAFDKLTGQLVKQYDAYEPLPGQHVQGALTLGENIADLAGLSVALDAYHRSLGGKPAPVIGGYTGDQRFYLGWAQVWRSKYREAALRQQLLTDPHSPGEQRTAVVRNLDAWYGAFGAQPGQKLYLADGDRVRIW